mgnify:CR=1 FL=1|jgi:hypothetical protein
MSAGTFFKTFSSSDRTTTRTLLHEAIPITGTLVSGTYAQVGVPQRNANIKTYSHGMFQSVYDYPYLSSSANHIFDVTCGFSTNVDAGSQTSVSGTATVQVAKKVNIYNQMAQTLVGYDTNGSIRPFDQDGDLSAGTKIHNAVFLNFSRLLVKDEIKKGSFRLDLGVNSSSAAPFAGHDGMTYITDAGAETSYKVNSPAGEYGLLKSGSTNVGLIYYQAGIAVLTSSIAGASSSFGGIVADRVPETCLTSETIDVFADSFRHRISNVSFNNTTELNSTIYFCRANHNEFNYSSNPTYLTGSKIRVKNENILAPPKSYVTTVGLYSADNELLAVAKLSEPLRKDPSNELTLRVRLDY